MKLITGFITLTLFLFVLVASASATATATAENEPKTKSNGQDDQIPVESNNKTRTPSFFDYIETSDATLAEAIRPVPSSFYAFFQSHSAVEFAGSAIHPAYRAVLNRLEFDAEEYEMLFAALREAYMHVSSAIPEPLRWNSAVDFAFCIIYSTKQYDFLERIFNKIVIPNSPMKSFFTEPFKAEMFTPKVPVERTFIDFKELELFRSVIFEIVFFKYFNVERFSEQQVKLWTALSQYGNSLLWRSPSVDWHLTFVLNSVMSCPLIFLHSVAKFFDPDSALIPSFEEMATSIYKDLSVIHPELLELVIKRSTSASELPTFANYIELTNTVIEQRGKSFFVISPINAMKMLKFLCDDPIFKSIDHPIFNMATAIIKNRVMKPKSFLDWTFFWLFYEKYIDATAFAFGTMRLRWISLAFCLIREMEEITGKESFKTISEHFINYFRTEDLTEDYLFVVTSSGHIPTVDLLMERFDGFLTTETLDELLLVASKFNYNGIGHYYLNKMNFSAEIVEESKDAIEESRKVKRIEKKEDDTDEQAKKRIKIEESAKVPVTIAIPETEVVAVAVASQPPMSTTESAEEEDDFILQIIDSAIANYDDDIIYDTIANTRFDQANIRTIEKIITRLIQFPDVKLLDAALFKYSKLKFSAEFRYQLVQMVLEKGSDLHIAVLMRCTAMLPEIDRWGIIYLWVVEHKSVNVIDLFLYHWHPHLSIGIHDVSLMLAVRSGDLAKVDFITKSDVTEFSNVGLTKAILESINIGAHHLTEFMLSEEFNITIEDYILEDIKAYAKAWGYEGHIF